MNIRKWTSSKKVYKLKVGRKQEGDNIMENTIKRPNSVLKSIEISFQEIQDFNKGKKKLKSLKESQQLWDKWAEESENESR